MYKNVLYVQKRGLCKKRKIVYVRKGNVVYVFSKKIVPYHKNCQKEEKLIKRSIVYQKRSLHNSNSI